MLTAVDELDTGAGDEVFDGAGHHDLRPLRERGYPLTDVYGHPANIVTTDFDFAGMQPHTDIEAQGRRRVADGARTADPACRPVEGGQEAITSRLDFATAERRQLMPDRSVPSPFCLSRGTRKMTSSSSILWCSLLGAGAMCSTPSHISSQRSMPIAFRRASSAGLTSTRTALMTRSYSR